jgi:predicted phage terminase large subunit-like protein
MDVIKRLSEKSLYFFAKFVLNYDWLDAEIHLPLCKILENFASSKRVKATLPRSWLKSTVCTISYPIWRAVKNPEVCVLLVQNSATNAKGKLRSIRGHFDNNELLRAVWPHVLPDKNCRWTSDSLELRRKSRKPEGTFDAAGRATQLVGRHYNVVIEDDTVAPDKDEYTEDNVLPTKDDIGQAIGFHQNALFLLIDPNVDQILVVGTRWFELDLLSWIDQREGDYYISYTRACKETNGMPDPDGKLAWPSKYGEASLEMIERAVGPYLFSCLYLNTPLRSEDMIFQKKWFDFYDIEPAGLDVHITIDPAGNPKLSTAKKKKKNDYNVIMVCGSSRKTGVKYVLDYKRFKGGPEDLITELFPLVVQYQSRLKEVGVEGIAYQESLDYILTEAMRARNIFFSIKLLKHGGRSKEWRIRNLQPLVKTKTILFKGWMRELIAELEVFPLGANDDLPDALAMFLQLWGVRTGKEEAEEEEQDDKTAFTLEAALRSLASRHKPPEGVMDVLYMQEADLGKPSPYQHLFEQKTQGLQSKPSLN